MQSFRMYQHVLKMYAIRVQKKLAIMRAFLAGAVGIEPTSTVLETAVLPLNYAPIRSPYRTDENHNSTDFWNLQVFF